MRRVLSDSLRVLRSQGIIRCDLSHRGRGRSTATNEPLFPQQQEKISLFKNKVNQVMLMYEDFIGIKQVKEAQNRAETCFKASQQQRRASQEKVAEVQNQLRVIRMDIDRTARGDNRYLELIKNEIDIIREEREVRSHFEELEERERELFSELSNALRMSHEKERAQGEKTKYWSIFGSLVGAFLGILGTTLNTRMRHNQTKDILLQTSSHVAQIEKSVQDLSLKLGVEPLTLDNTKLSDATHLVTTMREHEKLLCTSVDMLFDMTKTLEKVTVQLQRHNNWGNEPIYFDTSEINPVDIWNHEQGVVLMGFLLLMVAIAVYSQY